MGKRRQIPGKEYTFIKRRTGEEDTGILPQAYGESNDFVYWNPKKNFSLGGYWTSRKFKKDRSITDYRKRPEENKNNSKRWAAANPEKVRAACLPSRVGPGCATALIRLRTLRRLDCVPSRNLKHTRDAALYDGPAGNQNCTHQDSR